MKTSCPPSRGRCNPFQQDGLGRQSAATLEIVFDGAFVRYGVCFLLTVCVTLRRADLEAHSNLVQYGFPRRFFKVVLIALMMVVIDPCLYRSRGKRETAAHALPALIHRAAHAPVVPGMRIAISRDPLGADKTLHVPVGIG